MGRSIAVVCPKGGVGKTTVAVNLAGAFAERGLRCLLIGTDPQCGLIGSFGRDRFDIDHGLYDYFDPDGSPELAIQSSGTPNLDFITSNIWCRDEEQALIAGAAADPGLLRRATAHLKESYDFLFFDCPPNLGPLTYSALVAADAFLVPLQTEELAFLALPRLFDSLSDSDWGPEGRPELLGIVLNQVDTRTRLTASVIRRVREEHGDDVLRTAIPRSVRLAEVAQRGKPVHRFNRVGSAARAFDALAEELIESRLSRLQERELAAAATPVDGDLPRETLLAPPLPDNITRADEITRAMDEPVGDYLPNGERILSLSEVREPEMIGGLIRNRPSLDDYDSGEEEEGEIR